MHNTNLTKQGQKNKPDKQAVWDSLCLQAVFLSFPRELNVYYPYPDISTGVSVAINVQLLAPKQLAF